MNNLVVGEDIILPSSLRLQIALLSVAEAKNSILPVGVGAYDDPRTYGLPPCIRMSFFDCRGDHRSSEVVSVTATHPSVILPDCRGRRPRRPEKDNGNRRTLFKAVILSGVSRYCNRRAHKSKNRHAAEPFFDRDRRKKAREWFAHEPRDLQKDYI